MEEKNNKKKILLVLSIFVLLLVLSVGGVYAYFSARVNNSGSAITGQTLNINGSTLTVAATRLNLNPSPAPVSDNLVPAYYGVEPEEMTTTAVNRALSKACVVGGYTGCHVWKIVASTTQNVQNANILLNLSLSNVSDEDEWSYVVYTGTDSTSSTILNSGSIITDFPNSATIDIHNDGPLTTSGVTYYVMVYLNNENAAQNDGVTNNTTDARGTYNGSVILEAMNGEVMVNFLTYATKYVTDLYTSAAKTTATVNNITYNLAPSVNLMNDRHASMDTSINGGDIRYYGANPNNYVWLGDTYTSDYSYGVSYSALNSIVNRNAGDKKLWRIIGVFDGRIKLISNDPITTAALSWDTSNVNGGSGINQWGPSTYSDTGEPYDGADLMMLLNPGYENHQDMNGNNGSSYMITINNSLYWNKSVGTVYNNAYYSNLQNISFENTGLTESERSLIDTVTWYTGAYNDYSYVDVHYNAERGSMGKICTQGTSCKDKVVRTSTWSGKVGLLYPSDYGYAVDLTQCNSILSSYNDTNCYTNDWLRRGSFTMTPYAGATYSTSAYVVSTSTGALISSTCSITGGIRSVIYLKPEVVIDLSDGKDGSEEHPYVLSY